MNAVIHHNDFDATSGWFTETGQQPVAPKYDAKQVCFYLGMQIEELSEKLVLLTKIFHDEAYDGPSPAEDLAEIASLFKAQAPRLVAAVDQAIRANPEQWIDADCDSIWVSIGAIRAAGIEPTDPYDEVIRANWAKRFADGTFHNDANGKIIKPEGWMEPDHSRFVRHLKA